MVRTLLRSRWFWACAALALGIGLYLALAIFEVQALFINRHVNEPMPVVAGAEQPVLLASGEFHDVVHSGRGKALLYRRADRSLFLRLEDLDVDNGPDLYVYLVAAPDATDSATVQQAAFFQVGELKGNRGSQNYELASTLAHTEFPSVTIWCKRFGVNFATAPLTFTTDP